ncbi:MAG: TetR/AcrR family transcriptional regulator [Terracidiphilus sp.]
MTPEAIVGTTDRAAETRSRILGSALHEFAALGLAGARTERIANAAGVNKALLYYYFESKEKLYAAALEMAAVRVRDSSLAVYESEGSAGERLLRIALNHFDRILGQREFQSLMQQEMIRLHKGESTAMQFIVKKVFEPVFVMYRAMVAEGVASGELIEADWMQMQLASLGANVFYFLSAPIWRMVLDHDPLTCEALADRRRLLLEFLGQAIFTDRQRGRELSAKIYADTPMPPIEKDRFEFGRKV